MEKQGGGHVCHHDQPGRPCDRRRAVGARHLTKGGMNSATKSLAIGIRQARHPRERRLPGVIKTPMHAPETHGFLAALHPVAAWVTSRSSCRRCCT
jgi:hypothetical protein